MISTKELSTATLQKSKSPPMRLQNYDSKLEEALQLNGKLKELLGTMKNNAVARRVETGEGPQRVGEEQQVARLKKRQLKLTSQLQQLTNNLNVLVSENGKLKSQVDGSRNSRVIYSNVYKTIEKEIRKHEQLYKLAIIDSLSYEEVLKRAHDRLHKTARKLEKDIAELEGAPKPLRKKEKRKSRLDTGLSSYRQDSKDTCRASNQEKTNRQEPLRNPSVRETALSKRDQPHKKQESALHAQKAGNQKAEFTGIRGSRAKTVIQVAGDSYQLELRGNYYDNLIKHLREISGHDDLRTMLTDWQQADSQIETEYSAYLQLQKEIKVIREEKETLERQLQIRSQREIQNEKTVEEEELSAVEQQLQAEHMNVAALQQRLTTLIDINTTRLTDQEVQQHVQRIKRRGEATTRELQKLFQGVTKEKTQNVSINASRVTTKSRPA